MLTMKQSLRLSAVIDKMDITISNPEGTQEQVGADLMLQVVRKAHKAEQEIYSLISDVQKITPAQAEDVDLIDFVKGLISDPKVVAFFKSAVKLKAKG